MTSRFDLVLRVVPAAVACVMMIASVAAAQPVDGTEAPAEYQRDVVQPDDPSGTTDEIDAAEAQYEAAEAGEDTGLTRKATAQVEEIVVSARKRAEALEDTPVAVTAVTGGTLREAGVYRVDQVTELVPNLQFQDSIQGNLAQFAIRGVGTGNPDIQFDPGVALYLDGVFLPRASGSLLSVVDVQQIEVLRGPQGTLFGKNSVGGAINITTVKPQHELEGFAMVRPSNFNGLDAEVMLNVPIVEDFLLSRVAFFSAQRDGYVFDSFRDELYSDRNELAFIGSLRMLATDDLTLDLTGMWSRSQTKGRAGQCIDVRGPDSGDEAPLAGLYAGMFPECQESTLFENTANIAGMSDIKSYGTWGVMNWDPGDVWEIEDFAIKAQGSWNQQIPRTRFDVDNTSSDVVYLSTAGAEDGGISKFDGAPGFQQQIAGELQINGAAFDGRLVFVTGLFAQWESMTDDRATNVGPPLNRLTRNVAENSNWTWAPYLQATANPIDWLSITGGIRYTQDHKSLTLSQFQYAGPTVPGRPVTEEIFFPRETQLFTAWTPMGSIASTAPVDLLPDWMDHLMGYFTYAQGFKGGGFNALAGPRQEAGTSALAASFDPETLDNFELGFKSIFWDNKLTLNTAFFIGKYDDIQKVSVVTDGTGEDTVTQRITENAAKATIKGFEIESLLYPIEGLQITGNIGVTDAKYDDFPDAVSDYATEGPDGPITIDRSGESFNNVPEFTSFVAIQYSMQIDGDSAITQGWLTPRFEWYYQSKVHMLGPELVDTIQPGYNLLNARLSYDFWDDRAQVALWGKNLADQEYINWSTGTVSTFGFLVNFAGLPRTWGGEISYRFD